MKHVRKLDGPYLLSGWMFYEWTSRVRTCWLSNGSLDLLTFIEWNNWEWPYMGTAYVVQLLPRFGSQHVLTHDVHGSTLILFSLSIKCHWYSSPGMFIRVIPLAGPHGRGILLVAGFVSGYEYGIWTLEKSFRLWYDMIYDVPRLNGRLLCTRALNGLRVTQISYA